MTSTAITFDPSGFDEPRPSRGRVAMICLIAAEGAIFTIFVVAYLFYMGKSLSGPSPKDVLETPILPTISLLASSLTIHLAAKALRRGAMRNFKWWWLATTILGEFFLFATVGEWHRLIDHEGLTVHTNLFGTTYYSLVGLHAFHVIVGLVALVIVMVFAFLGRVEREQSYRVDVVSLYWHFVDAVWVVVFTVVYMIGR